MFKIAFCDDNTNFLKNIKDFANEYLKNKQISAERCTYNISTVFLKQFKSNPFYFDIVFFDIDRPIVDGIEVVQEIKASNKSIMYFIYIDRQVQIH